LIAPNHGRSIHSGGRRESALDLARERLSLLGRNLLDLGYDR
jgi:hypothetical protein